MRGVLRNLRAGRPTPESGAPAVSAPSATADPDVWDAEARLRLLDTIEAGDIGWFWATGPANELIYLSPSAERLIGSDAKGQPLASIMEAVVDEKEASQAVRPLGLVFGARHKLVDVPVRVKTPEGKMWWSLTGRPCFADDGETFIGYRGSVKDITELHEKQRDASRLAEVDSLTGLANRHRMTNRLATTLAACKAARRSCAMLLLDLDRFKQVNDTLGHPAGDELLRQVSERIQRIVPDQVEVGRIGGDEFQILIVDVDDRGRLGELAQKLIQMISQPYSLEGSRAVIGASVGIAIAPYDGVEPAELVKAADLALYAAKGGGRGAYRFYSNELKDTERERGQLAEDLRHALANDELALHYQPIIRASDNLVEGFEALLRWNHPERGTMLPGQFLVVAEETKLIREIGDWVVHRACEDASQWPGNLRVAVNISGQQIAADTLAETVGNAIEHTRLWPPRLEMEITESVFLEDPTRVQNTFAELRELGVRVALDDFGTGYSSLGYLRDAPYDRIKIDPSFVRGATDKAHANAAIISAIVQLGRAMNMQITAEGVEALDELELMRECGVNDVQGYIYAKPMRQAEVIERLAAGELQFEPRGPARYRPDRRTLFRRVGVIHEDHRYEAVMRNLSATGARIDGLVDVPTGTQLVVDLGQGQLVVAIVRRSQDAVQGIEFETPLISDGADGLCTRHRISPYALAAAGMPLQALPGGDFPLLHGMGNRLEPKEKTRPNFTQVEVSLSPGRSG